MDVADYGVVQIATQLGLIPTVIEVVAVVPEQLPVHFTKLDPAAGVAVN